MPMRKEWLSRAPRFTAWELFRFVYGDVNTVAEESWISLAPQPGEAARQDNLILTTMKKRGSFGNRFSNG